MFIYWYSSSLSHEYCSHHLLLSGSILYRYLVWIHTKDWFLVSIIFVCTLIFNVYFSHLWYDMSSIKQIGLFLCQLCVGRWLNQQRLSASISQMNKFISFVSSHLWHSIIHIAPFITFNHGFSILFYGQDESV